LQLCKNLLSQHSNTVGSIPLAMAAYFFNFLLFKGVTQRFVNMQCDIIKFELQHTSTVHKSDMYNW